MVSQSSRALLVLAALAVFCSGRPSCLASPIQGGASSTAPGDSVLFYGGDYGWDGEESNNTMLTSQYGSSLLTDFVVGSAGWHVTGLFSNNMKDYGPPPQTLSALWSIRTGTAVGDPGQVLFGGVADASVTPTGRHSWAFFGPDQYTIAVSGLSLDLKPGVYFMQVSPIASQQVYYVGLGGPDAVGTPGPSINISEDHFLWSDGQPENTVGGQSFVPASMGVVGEVIVPEPGSIIVFGVIIASVGVRGLLGRPRLRS